MSAVKRRQERVDETIRRQVSETILYRLKDPRISFVTVTRVETSSDFTLAKVYVSIMGTEKQQRETLSVLGGARKFIQSQFAPLLKTRNVPVLKFILDQSVKKSIRVSQLLREVMDQSAEREAEPGRVEAEED